MAMTQTIKTGDTIYNKQKFKHNIKGTTANRG